jgi:glycosyltransferase involved in cell wall biosynthesis
MYKSKKIGVVVPAYNEEGLIAATLGGIPEFVDSIVVIDDASMDGTAACVSEAAAADPRVALIRHAENQGVGGAVVDGYRRAIEDGMDIAVVMAGDNQMPPEHLARLLDHLIDSGYDAVKGNRFLASPTGMNMPRHRVLGNIVLTLLTKLASGYWSIFDAQNGYWAVTTDSLKRLDLSRIARRYDLENSMLISMNIIDARVADVAIPAVYGREQSTIRLWRDVPRILATLFTGFCRRVFLKYVLYNFHPIALFLFAGLALVLWGLGIGAWAAAYSIGPESASVGTVMLAVLPFLVGFQLLLAALVLDIINEPR